MGQPLGFFIRLSIAVVLALAPTTADAASKSAKKNKLCWQDYCPCVPPQGGADAGLCRMLRAGLYVDPQLLAGAAMQRDARKQMEEFK